MNSIYHSIESSSQMLRSRPAAISKRLSYPKIGAVFLPEFCFLFLLLFFGEFLILLFFISEPRSLAFFVNFIAAALLSVVSCVDFKNFT